MNIVSIANTPSLEPMNFANCANAPGSWLSNISYLFMKNANVAAQSQLTAVLIYTGVSSAYFMAYWIPIDIIIASVPKSRYSHTVGRFR